MNLDHGIVRPMSWMDLLGRATSPTPSPTPAPGPTLFDITVDSTSADPSQADWLLALTQGLAAAVLGGLIGALALIIVFRRTVKVEREREDRREVVERRREERRERLEREREERERRGRSVAKLLLALDKAQIWAWVAPGGTSEMGRQLDDLRSEFMQFAATESVSGNAHSTSWAIDQASVLNEIERFLALSDDREVMMARIAEAQVPEYWGMLKGSLMRWLRAPGDLSILAAARHGVDVEALNAEDIQAGQSGDAGSGGPSRF